MNSVTTHNATAAWRQSDLDHHLHPFTDQKGLSKEGGCRIITSARGVWLIDSQGERILDGMAGLWCVNVGYGQEALARAAYEQMLDVPYYNTFFKTATPPPIELSEKLASLTPEGLNKCFFATSGSEANDSIVRMVRRYWALKGKPEKTVFISRHNAYHGSTAVAASLGGMSFMHELDGLPLPGFTHVQQPFWFEEGGDLTPEEFGLKAARAVEERIEELGADKVAAFIGEPIQGAGGVIIPPGTYWPEVQRICKKHNILVIADEVICGFGRTGHWFASEPFGIKPDLMPIAKGLTSGYLPLSGVMVGDEVAQILHDHGGEFAHGFTYSGHPTSCAVALKNIEIIEEQGLVEKARSETGPYLQERLQELLANPLVGEIRGMGLIAAIQLTSDKEKRAPFERPGETAGRCRDLCMANNLIARAVADSIVLSPPLIISKDEIDELIKRLTISLNQTSDSLLAS
ncbi:MAG: aspartate aminotransferase family protein [Pseudomonadota bacterium]